MNSLEPLTFHPNLIQGKNFIFGLNNFLSYDDVSQLFRDNKNLNSTQTQIMMNIGFGKTNFHFLHMREYRQSGNSHPHFRLVQN